MTIGTAARAAPLTDAIIVAVSRLVDDAQVERRDPSHADLKFLFQQVGLADADLTTPAGKERRVRQVLSWAVEHDPDRGNAWLPASSLPSRVRVDSGPGLPTT
jgi:hypothetical protein